MQLPLLSRVECNPNKWRNPKFCRDRVVR